MNKTTLIQYFEWYLANDGSLWKQVAQEAKRIAALGIDKIWLPPAYKGASGKNDVGYGVYDMYDLGEFNQKGTIPTKYGTKDEYLQAIDACHQAGIAVIADIVFNHRMGADAKETIQARQMDWNHREHALSDEETVEVWTKYTFPGRKGKYSDFIWNWDCFDGTDYDALSKRNELLEFNTKQWDENVSHEDDNFDYIMGDDLDFSNPTVVEELYRWGKWYWQMCHVDGYRLDACKSIDFDFFPGWLQSQANMAKANPFAVGEYWSGNVNDLNQYLDHCNHCMTLFDVPLHFHLFDASNSYDQYNMATIFQGTLSQQQPDYAVAFVDNHDTQPGQALQSWIQGWFKIHAYALILLYRCKVPCVFYGDMYGISHDHIDPVPYLAEMCWIRKHFMSDDIEDRLDDWHCIGWMVRSEHPIIVVMTNSYRNQKTFHVGEPNEKLIDIITGDEVIIDANGNGTFVCRDGQCGIYLRQADVQTMKEEVK